MRNKINKTTRKGRSKTNLKTTRKTTTGRIRENNNNDKGNKRAKKYFSRENETKRKEIKLEDNYIRVPRRSPQSKRLPVWSQLLKRINSKT